MTRPREAASAGEVLFKLAAFFLLLGDAIILAISIPYASQVAEARPKAVCT